MPEYSVLGKSLPRVDALDKVMGRAVYSADVILPHMLYGKVLRSPHAHAKILRLDTSKAQALAGVMAVVTAADVPGQIAKGEMPSPMLCVIAKERVIFAGQPVAAVAAINPDIAEEALGLIEVDYEPLTPVIDILEAMKPDAPIIHPDVSTRNLPSKDTVSKNVFWYMKNIRGDVEAGFREADIVLENTFRTQTVSQGPIETRAAVADISTDGKITIWTDSQGIFKVRDLVADFLDLTLNYVRVMQVEVGGTFGSKECQLLAPLCALMAQKTGRPVRMAMTREEFFKANRPAPASTITLKMGVTRDGILTAASANIIYDFGALSGMGGMDKVPAASFTGLGPYRIPNLKIECFDVYTNKAPSGPYRGPTSAQCAFAVESQMDLLARALNMDPLEFRIKNAVAEGDVLPNGLPYARIGFRETLEKMKQYLSQRGKLQGENQGRGVACGLWLTGYGGSAAHINLNGDGSVVLVVGSVDVSGTRTTLSQMVAEELGIPFEKVSVVAGNTESAPYSTITAGSMTTRSMGVAVYRACQDVKDQLCRQAASQLEVEPKDLEFVQERFQVKGKPEKSVSLKDLARQSVAFFSTFGPITGRGAGDMLPPTPVFAVHTADVEVDKETGKVKVLSYAAVQDAGLVINPTIVEGQIQGAVAQGIGWALSENYVFQNGVMKNATLLDYRMPTAADVPFVETMTVEVSSNLTPFGIRGVGEPPIVPTLATLSNAIHSATGVRLKELPMTPETILKAIVTRG